MLTQDRRGKVCRRIRWLPRFAVVVFVLVASAITPFHPGHGADPIQIKPTSGWQAYKAGYTDPSALKQGDIVTLMGIFRRTSGKWGHLGTLPSGYRPPARLIFNVNHHEGSARVDVLRD